MLTGTSVLCQFLMLTTWGRIADVYGNRLILIVTSISLPIVPSLWLLSDNFWALIAFQALSGLSLVGLHSVGRQSALRARAANAPRGLRRVSQRRHGRRRFRRRDARRPARRRAAGARRAIRRVGHAQQPALPLHHLRRRTRILAALLARRVRELRKPRRAMSAPALVLRVTGLNAMVGVIYDFIGRPQNDADDRDEPSPAPPEASEPEKRRQ